jgi:hypothetical protein
MKTLVRIFQYASGAAGIDGSHAAANSIHTPRVQLIYSYLAFPSKGKPVLMPFKAEAFVVIFHLRSVSPLPAPSTSNRLHLTWILYN